MKSYSDGTVQLCFNPKTGLLETYYNGECKWCGKTFHKKHNKVCYCSEKCREYAKKEQKAKYQAKRRLLIKRKVLILPEYKASGMGSYGTSCNGHRRSKFEDEYRAVQREMQRLGLKKRGLA